ncbi:MAG: peptide deformylase [Candidatus Howiella sp.]|jgi:peptide deformylase
MAIREIVKEGDPCLTKVCRPVEKFDGRLWQLLDDMAETMHTADGVGLAAPQVGILRRAVIIDVGDGILELINPKVVAAEGEQQEAEGCLSCPGVYGITSRPYRVTVEALDRNGKPFSVEGEDLLARALCHEIDHLDGVLFRSHVLEYVEE